MEKENEKNIDAKVMFIIPKIKNLFGDAEAIPAHPHVGIAYLTSFLKSNGITVGIFDCGIEKKKDYVPEIRRFDPDIIGITTFSYLYKNFFDPIQRIKKEIDIPLVVGGPHVSATKGQILKASNADFALKQEGEYTLLELLDELKQENSDFSKIDGLIWKDKSGNIVENKDRGWIKDLDSMPIPDYEAFGLERYPYFSEKKLPIITSRGCPYGCNYCSVNLCMGKGFRSRSPGNVVAEIGHWYKKGFRNFEINDDCFNLIPERAMEICRLIIDKGLKITYQLYNGIRADRTTKDLLNLMKKSGCTFISYGCESGNPQILKNIKKALNLDQVRQAVRWTNEVGIKNSVNFIIGHPGETYDTAMDTINFARSLPASFVNLYNLIPYPGTELYSWIKQNGRFLVPEKDYLTHISTFNTEPIFDTPEFPKEQRIKAVKKGVALYEKRVLQFRFGKTAGYAAYLLTKPRFMAKMARYVAQGNPIGAKLYFMLTRKSRR